MFKKRTVAKKINLNQEVEAIPSTQQNLTHIQAKNTINLQKLEQRLQAPNQSHLQKKQQQNKQLEQCFEEWKRHQQQLQKEQMQEQKREKTRQVEILIDDDSVEILEVREDDEEMSSLEDLSADYEDGYENQIIRKTLTRGNYLKVSQGLKTAKKQTQKQSFLKKIKHISKASIRHRIQKDLKKKKQLRAQLKKQIQYIDEKLSKRNQQLQERKQSIQHLQHQFQDTKKILQFLYYHGDKVEEFEEQAILRQATKIDEEDDCIIIEDDYE